MIIRHENARDFAAIDDLTKRAFAPVPFSDGKEPAIIRQLRSDGDLTLSLVAAHNARLIGHVAFSPVTIITQPGDWYGLGPISVAPEAQRRGIASRMVRSGLSFLKAQKADGCVLVGDPKIYRSMGFHRNGKLLYDGIDTKFIQYTRLCGPEPGGALKYAPAFDQERQK